MNEILSRSKLRADLAKHAAPDVLAWFDLTDKDRQQAALLEPISGLVANGIIESFYGHILRFENASRQFSSDKQIDRVKVAQKRYFAELVSGQIDDAYIADRRRIGRIHEAAGITPTLHIGAYAYYLNRLGLSICDQMASDPDTAFKLYLSLQKIAHFDMALALETYVEAREAKIEAQQREMSELSTPVLKLREGLILIPVVGELNESRAHMLTVALLAGIRDTRARVVVLDITGVSFVDSAVANHLIQTILAAKLMGAKSVLTGVSPDVAQSLVRLGVSVGTLYTAGDLDSGIREAELTLGL
jgi:rsbT co-antagonist protein RsbR